MTGRKERLPQELPPEGSSVPPLGVVLAGGRSRRMGIDKRWLEIVRDGETITLVQWAVDRLSACCDQTVVAVREHDASRFAQYETVVDAPGISGPLAGILGASRAASGSRLLVLATDLPNVPVGLLQLLVSEAGDELDWVAPGRLGKAEPLCALYGSRAVAALERRAERKQWGLQALFQQEALCGRWIGRDRLRSYGDPAEVLLNLNTATQLERLRASGQL